MKLCFTVNSESLSLLMSFASASVFHHEYASRHAATPCAQVPYVCFVLLFYTHSFVTGGSCSWLHLVHSRTWDGMEGGGGFWGCCPSHLNASMSVAISLLTMKHYEIWPPRCSFGKLNFYVSFTVGHTGQQ